jgi:4,5-DOPA dioxygenase extradiol
MPAIFFGHGNPMLTLSANPYTEAWAAIGRALPEPKAVLAISAHWYIRQSATTVAANPATIHDFGGFPKELFAVEYPAPGSPELAGRVQSLLSPAVVRADEDWGLDHGTWTVLRHVFPKADVPIVQLSIDRTQPPQFHFDLGQRLMPLREEGVLIVGSGNIVHNLAQYDWGGEAAPIDWAVRFDQYVQESLASGEAGSLIDYPRLGQDARLSIPTPDHYLPFLYVLGLRQKGEAASYPVEGFDGGTMSMRAVQLG